jgi:hypothetical protein
VATAEDKERLDTIRARHSAASFNWQLTYDRDRNEQLSANLIPNVPVVPIAVLTMECGYPDRDFLLHAHSDFSFLFMLLARAARKIRTLEKEMEAPRPDLSKECGQLCEDSLFKKFLSEKHGIPATDRERLATGLRNVLQIGSRSDLNTDPAAARRWNALLASYRDWKDAA